jgi:uncharacterized RmlC-like cupin family protein
MAGEKYVSEVKDLAEFKVHHPYKGVFFKNLKTHPVHGRELRGNKGAYFELGDNRVIDAHVSEIPPGGHSKNHRHTHEAVIYILSGRGYSIFRKEGQPEQRVDWEEGDLFSPPLMAWHMHCNADPAKPARYLAITDTPFVDRIDINIIDNAEG